MFWFVYNLLFHLVYLLMLPHFLWRMWKRGGYRKGFLQRAFVLSRAERARVSEGRRIWVHAVSVGELSVGLAFMREWRKRHPEAAFLVTVNTSTAHRIAEEKLDARDVLLYPPLDSPPVIRRLLKSVDLEALVLVETEMWPNLLRLLRGRNVPVMLLNGRVSDRSHRRLKQVPSYTRRLYPLVDLYCMQGERDARRAVDLGAPRERVRVMHSAKYDVADRNAEEERSRWEALRSRGFLERDSVILLGSSTWPGEEQALMRMYHPMRKEYPRLRLVLVPRHFERTPEVLAEAEDLGLRCARWSEWERFRGKAPDVVVVDTTGELMHFTGLARVVFVGKSLFRLEGQNPIEAAHAGCFLVTGRGMDNFREVMEDLRSVKGVKEVKDAVDLELTLRDALDAPQEAADQGRRARELVRSRRGSLRRSADELEKMLSS